MEKIVLFMLLGAFGAVIGIGIKALIKKRRDKQDQ